MLAGVRRYQSIGVLENLSYRDEHVCWYMRVPSTGKMSVYMCDVQR